MEVKQLNAKYMYDSRLDVVKIEAEMNYKYKESIDLEAGVYLDFDENYFPVNLEIIDASKKMGVDEEFLANPSGNVKIVITRETISANVVFENNNKNGILNIDTFGEDYIPNIETNFALV